MAGRDWLSEFVPCGAVDLFKGKLQAALFFDRPGDGGEDGARRRRPAAAPARLAAAGSVLDGEDR